MILSRPPLRVRPQETFEPRRPRPSLGLVEDILDLTQRIRRSMRFGHSHISLEIGSLCRFLGQDRKLAAYAVCNDPRLEPAVRALQAVADRAGCELEKELARQLVGDPTRRNHYLGQVGEFASWEARCARIGPLSKVLFIGSGALPVTALTLVRELRCQVTCLDRDRLAAELSRKALAQLGCPERLQVVHGSLADVDVESYTHIWIASLVPNKTDVLEVLARRAHPTARVLVRYGEGLHRIFNYELEPDALRGWLVQRRLERKGHLHSTLLLSRETLHFPAERRDDGPLGNVLIVGAGPVAVSYATLLSRPGHCRRVEMLARPGERAQALADELRASGGQVHCDVSAPHLEKAEGTGQLHAVHFSPKDLTAFDTVILAVPAGSYVQAARELPLRPGTLVVLPSAALGSAAELAAELPEVTLASFSNYFAAAKPSSGPTRLLVRGLKKKVYLGLTRPDSRAEALIELLGTAGVAVEDLGRAAAAESRNITTYVHPSLFIDDVALASVLRFEPSLKKMYKLYPEGPLTKASMERMVRLWREISALQRAMEIPPVNLLKFLNDDNYPVHEHSLPREDIEAFPSLDFTHQVLLLYVRYTSLLVDPFSEPDPQTGRYQDFSAVAFPHVRRVGGQRVELPRIPREDYETLKVLASLGRRQGVSVPQIDALCAHFEGAVAAFEDQEGVTADLDVAMVHARAERLAELLA